MPLRRQMTMGSRQRNRLLETPQKSQKYSPSVDRERLRMRAAEAEVTLSSLRSSYGIESSWDTVKSSPIRLAEIRSAESTLVSRTNRREIYRF